MMFELDHLGLALKFSVVKIMRGLYITARSHQNYSLRFAVVLVKQEKRGSTLNSLLFQGKIQKQFIIGKRMIQQIA